MLISLSLIIIIGLFISYVITKIKIPNLVGFIIAGILLGPYVLDLIDTSILNLSEELRSVALVIILFRAGLMLDLKSLKSIGKLSIILSVVPAVLEIIIIAITANMLFEFDLKVALLLGCVVAAASPAVIVPRMIELIKAKKGLAPKLIITSATLEDVIVIVLFATVLEFNVSGDFSFVLIMLFPLKIILGILIGLVTGIIISKIIDRYNIKLGNIVLIIIAISLLFISVEKLNLKFVHYSGLLAVMTLGIVINSKQERISSNIESSFSNLWLFAQIMLFVLIGAEIDIMNLQSSLLIAIVIITIGLVGRFVGIVISLSKSNFSKSEKWFVLISFIPKATVQAAIGGIPLALDINRGETILVIAVTSIIITAPIGAVLIDKFNSKLL